MRIYIETTVFNRYLEDERDYSKESKQLFERFKAGLDEPFTSYAVIEELGKAEEPKQSAMINLIQQYSIKVLEITDAVSDLAEIYIETGIIPQNYRFDGIHIAVAAVNDMDCIVSLNFRHINRLKTKNETRIANLLKGYSSPDICTPMEVI
jgi:predicted nucleic acid-binding protein